MLYLNNNNIKFFIAHICQLVEQTVLIIQKVRYTFNELPADLAPNKTIDIVKMTYCVLPHIFCDTYSVVGNRNMMQLSLHAYNYHIHC